MASLEHFIVKTISQGQQKTAKQLTAKLRRRAYDAGWPSHAGRHLTVVPENKGFAVTYPKQHASHIEAMEYGTQETQPSPVVRQFLAGAKDTDLSRHIGASLRKAGWI